MHALGDSDPWSPHPDEWVQQDESAMSVVDQMRDEFLAEATELLDEMNADLLTLESEGASEARDLVAKVLRAAHSLKGSSGMFGLEDLSQASHSLEGMLDDLVQGRAPDADALIEASLEQVEAMRYLLGEAGNETETKSPPRMGDDGTTEIARHTPKAEEAHRCGRSDPPDESQQFLRVNLAKLDHALNLAGDLFLGAAHLKDLQKTLRQKQEALGIYRHYVRATRLMERRLTELRESLLDMRMVPMARVFTRLVPAVRSVTRRTGKKARLTIEGGETRLDKVIAERLADPLLHLIRNAIDHGIEEPSERKQLGKPVEGRVSLSARRAGAAVIIEVSDDGRGIDLDRALERARARGLLPQEGKVSTRQILECLFMPGFSTADSVSAVSGRGVGMDVVRCNTTRLSGTVAIRTDAGRGTTVSIRVPPTLSTIDGLLVGAGGQMFVFPFQSVVEVVQITDEARQGAVGQGVLPLKDRRVRAVSLAPFFGLNGEESRERFAVIVGRDAERLAILVDALGERAEVLVKPLGPRLDPVPALLGVAELADGRVAMVLDILSVMEGTVSIDGAADELQ